MPASSTARYSYKLWICLASSKRAIKPRFTERVRNPSTINWFSTSRSGVRLTFKRRARSTSLMRSPGLKSNRTAIALTAPYNSACPADVRAAGRIAKGGCVMAGRFERG
ncbi:hypothetical protein D3C87_1664990 [compost metagenome]